MGTTIYGMTAQYWESVAVGFENRVVSRGLTLPQRKAEEILFCGMKIFGLFRPEFEKYSGAKVEI
jgi:hypothetical protein